MDDERVEPEILYQGYRILCAPPGWIVVRPDGAELREWGRIGSLGLARAVVDYDRTT